MFSFLYLNILKIKDKIRLSNKIALLISILSIGNIEAATYYSRATGNWNNTNTWSTTSYGGAVAASTPGAGAGDVVMISGFTVTVTATPTNAVASIIMSQTNNTGNDTKLYLNTTGIILTCNLLSLNDNNRGDNMDVEVAQGTLQVNGTATFVRSTSNSQNERLRLYINNTGRVNITGNLDFTLNRAQNNQSGGNEIEIINSGRLDVTGNFNATIGNNNGDDNDFEFVMNNTAICNVGGNASLTVSNSNDGDDLTFDLNGGTFTVSGTVTGTIAASATSSNSLEILIDGSTMSTGALTFTQSGGGNGDMNIKLNSSSTATPAALTVNGNLTYTHNNGDNMEIENNSNATITITQDLSVTLSASSDGDNVYLDFNGGTVNAVNGTITMAGGATSSNYIYFNVDGTTVGFTGNLTLIQNGGGGNGDMNFFLNANATSVATAVTVGGNLMLDHGGGDNYEIELNNNSTLTITGNMTDTLASSDGDDFFIDINGGTFTVSQNFNHVQTTLGGTTEDLNIRIDGTGRFNIGNDVYLNHRLGGQISIYTNTNAGSTAEFNVGRDFTIYHAGAADGEYIQTDQSSRFTVGRNFLIDNNASGGDNARIRMNNTCTFNVGGNFTMNLLSGLTTVTDNIEVDLNGGAMSVGGNLTMNSSSGNDAIITIDASTTSLSVTGTLILQHTGGDLNYITLGNASGSPTVTIGGLTINDAGGNITYCRLYNSSILNVNGNITLSALAASQVDIGVYSTSELRIRGNFIRAASPSRFGVLSCATGSTVEYNGTSLQTIAGDGGDGADGFAYGGVRLNNAAGFTMTATEGVATIPNGASLTFTIGIVNSSSSAFFIIANGASVNSASNTSYVDGPIRKVGNSSFTFPIGDNGNYQPATISAPSNATHHFTAQYFSANPGLLYNPLSLGAGIDHISKCEYWNIDRTSGASTVTITVAFDAGSCGVTSLAALRIARWDGTTWVDQGNGGTTGTTSAGTIVNGTAITTYLSPNSPFTLASSTSSNPLPVEMISFNAKALASSVALNWSTATETNNDYFEVQRSQEGSTFETIKRIKGAGNSNRVNNYDCTDEHPYRGVSYYRLKQVDFNGEYSISDTKLVKFLMNNKKEDIVVFPNPSNGNLLNIAFTDPVSNTSPIKIQIFDQAGKLILTIDDSMIMNNDGNLLLKLNNRLESGLYILKLTEDENIFNKLIVIK